MHISILKLLNQITCVIQTFKCECKYRTDSFKYEYLKLGTRVQERNQDFTKGKAWK